MGLREVKAARTRTAIVDAALDAFEERGYADTTMEQIAASAEVSPSTLYRYFPTKDSILMADSGLALGNMARIVRARPADEPLPEVLGAALHLFLEDADRDRDRLLRVRRALDVAPDPRARLWDVWNKELALLEEAIAERSHSDVDELWVSLAAHTVMMVAKMALDLMRERVDPRPSAEYADEIIRLIAAEGTVMPRLPRR